MIRPERHVSLGSAKVSRFVADQDKSYAKMNILHM